MATRVMTIWNSPRRWVLVLALAAGVLLIASIVFFLGKLQQAFVPSAPSAFYTPPNVLPKSKPGTVIRSEPLNANLPKGAQAYRLMYLSTGMNGQSIAVSGTIVAPTGTSATPRPVIAWPHGTTGIFPECGVSHTSDPYQQTPIIARMVNEGFVVTITDYPGLSTPGIHPYMVGPIEATSVLDSVRAAHQLDVSAGDRFVVWGASQGGHAALWAAQMAPEYAPELSLIGAAASAPATDLRGIVKSKPDDKVGGIFLGYVLRAWSAIYPNANLDRIIKPEMRDRFEAMVRPCFTAPAAFLTVGGLLTPNQYLSVDILNTEPWSLWFNKSPLRFAAAISLTKLRKSADIC